jgi:integrase
MSVYIPKGTSEYWFDFWRGGQRFRGATGKKNERDALAVEKAEKRKAEGAKKQAGDAKTSLAFNAVIARYWHAKGQKHAGADNTWRDLCRLQDHLNEAGLTHITDLTDADVVTLIAKRKATAAHPLANGTINRSTIEQLRKLFTFCKTRERVRFEHEPLWGDHLLDEPDEHPRELEPGELEKIEAALRDDYAPLFAFAHATGLRQRECYDLRWSEVLWDARQIRRQGKGGKPVTRPITDAVRAILWPLRGHHPEFVFTYVAARTQNVPVGKRGSGERGKRVAGQRYPIGKGNLWSRWRRDREASGVTDFKFHDLRHDLATKALRETGDLKLVQKMLGHADLRTTSRYAHVTAQDVAAGFDTVQGVLAPRAQKSPKKSPKILGKAS